jgi:tetratricopeptide (TPR) repeat protein
MANIDSLDNLFYKADKALDDGEFEAAKELLIQLISEEPKYGQAYNHLGWLYKNKFADTEKAEKYYQLAIQYAPNYPACYFNYIYLLRDQGRLEELAALLKKAEGVKQVLRNTYYDEMGSLYEMQGNYNEAIRYYRLAIGLTLNKNTIDDLQQHISRCIEKRKIFASNRLVRAFRVLFGKE